MTHKTKLLLLQPLTENLPEVGDALVNEARRLDNRLYQIAGQLQSLLVDRTDFVKHLEESWKPNEIRKAKVTTATKPNVFVHLPEFNEIP